MNEVLWEVTQHDLRMLSAHMDKVNETPRKERTPKQLALLTELRRLTRIVGDYRYELLKEKK